MNQLSDYITERIRIDNIKQVDWVDFPVTGTPEQINDFLLSAGFEKVSSAYGLFGVYELIRIFNRDHKALFYYGVDHSGGVIRFVDTSHNEISKDNSMYEVWYDRNMKPIEFCIINGMKIEKFNQKEFVESLLNRFV